ncbi:alpha/beta fold hydrolase [Nocardioides marmotae]|uniref:alpha/beta fold hydrolase n=1 Tax=Nocardioides marmotae TaxID=2663857 RepID=UPI0012B609B3|nr:alpha/beta hydrolase [Nocardioides marmotae]MBC9731947.1 alpha/beta hydrolase [Nocardioides marmotae]MTB83068.1 alpha/beta fold hydrolase [Nocardioides marmotae]
MIEREIVTGRHSILVREAGDSEGTPIVYFHGTPGSRLDVSFGEEIATALGVRVVSFDRPGYGGSGPGPYSLISIAHEVDALADSLGIGRFAAFGWSGGGPFALAAAAVLGERVVRAGVAGGNAPFQQVPGALESFTDNDRLALSFLPDEPARAAEQFVIGNEEMLQTMMSVRDDEQAPWIDWLWGETDPGVVSDPVLRGNLFSVLHEGLRQGPMGVAWDNVAWCGPWGIEVEDIRCPVHLWYGELDQMAPPVNGEWLRHHLPDASLVVYPGEGHLVPLRHWEEIVGTLTR